MKPHNVFVAEPGQRELRIEEQHLEKVPESIYMAEIAVALEHQKTHGEGAVHELQKPGQSNRRREDLRRSSSQDLFVVSLQTHESR